MKTMTTFQTFSDSRDNNFNLIRMVAASMVLVSHAYPIALGAGTSEPLSTLLGVKLGTLAVYVFFAISGFLIAQSLDRSSSVTRFLIARVLRIFPALFVMLMLTALVLGPIFTSLHLDEYFSSGAAVRYVLHNLSLAFLMYDLPGVFDANPYGPAINGSLWTLVYEVICYLGVLAIGMAGAFRTRAVMAVALAFFAAGYAITVTRPAGIPIPERLTNLADLGLPFALGSAFYAWRDRLPLNWGIGLALAAGAALLAGTALFHEALIVAVSYWVFLLGYLPGGAIRAYNRLGDYSYGVYIFAFPMQQVMAALFSPMSPALNMALAAPATLFLAVLSWHLVEKPALAVKQPLAQRLSPG